MLFRGTRYSVGTVGIVGRYTWCCRRWQSGGSHGGIGGQDAGGNNSGSSSSTARPRSPLAQAAWDYKEEAKARIQEDCGLNTESAFEILANHRIRASMAAGDFDHLPGAGQPRIAGQTAPDPAMQVMKNAGVLPRWIEAGKEARALRAQLRGGGSGGGGGGGGGRSEAAADSRAAAIERLRGLIKEHNEGCPPSLQMPAFIEAAE